MASFIPVKLLGDNLGQRHRYLNSLVLEAKESGVLFHDIEVLPEQSPVDRLFKIDLAVKLKNVDYIIRNLKDDDMLYVSRALKSTWLIDQRDIINPKYLEDVLFPSMVTPAVSKTKHWLYINLRDPAMCQEFYQYYRHDKFEFALKFLSHCSNGFILDECPKILPKLTPHNLKVLSEKCPKVAKLYFDSLATDEDVRSQYLNQQQSFYNSVKCVLKTDADVFLDITEKYFYIDCFSRLSPVLTDYILRCHKVRFANKLELYVAYLLHIPTVADRLSIEECQEVVLKLARAKFLQHWFEYKVVEPLIKRLSPDKRAAFKKRVFVEKDIGDSVDEWPYEVPAPPIQSESSEDIFHDQDFTHTFDNLGDFRAMLKKRKYCKWSTRRETFCRGNNCMPEMRSGLDQLFDEFRFIGFDRALHELEHRLSTTGSADRRRDIFLVLVSKSGGRNDAVAALLRLAARHSNEPAHTRAAVLRSLVKRANVWRLPADEWQHFLDFGHGLGLDGLETEAVCSEGLHAVVIRQLLAGECESAICAAFLSHYSSLKEYSLKAEERAHVAIGLRNMLETAMIGAEPALVAQHLSKLVNVLKTYRVRVEPASPMVKAVVTLALNEPDIARPLLDQFYHARIARHELFGVNLKFRRDEATLLNALRHDFSSLELNCIVNILADSGSRYDSFISKLVVYFQTEDFTRQLTTALKVKILQEKKVKLTRLLVSLMGNDLSKEFDDLDAVGPERVKLTAAFKACAHRARPQLDIADWGWHKAGVKAVATRAMRCRELAQAELTRALAADRRTIRVALALCMRRGEGRLIIDTFAAAAKLRPAAALRAAVLYFHRYDIRADPEVWNIVKPILSTTELSPRKRLRRLLEHTTWIPSAIKADYFANLYFAISKISNSEAQKVLSDLSKLPTSDKSIESILLHILETTDKDIPAISCPGIFVRYLMLSRNEEDFEERFAKIGNRFLKRLDFLRHENDSNFETRLDQLIESLKYNAAFLDVKFTTCLSVIERIVAWMHTFMSKDKYFKKYVRIHLTMLYYKAVRQSMKQMPEVFADPKRRKSEGVDAVGFVFGRYIAKEVAELVATYFDSIIELYTDALVDYLGDYFIYGNSRSKLIGAMLKGIMAQGVGTQRRLAVYVLASRWYDVDDVIKDEIKQLMASDQTIDLFYHATISI